MQFQDVMIHLLMKQPFYGYIAGTITPTESKDVQTVKMAVAPSLRIIYNPEWFGSLPVQQAVGTVMHELLHLLFLHPFRKGGRESNLWVVACDMAVNEHLEKELLPEDSITVDIISKEIEEKIPGYKSAEFYYDIISKGEAAISLIEKDSEIKLVLKSGQELKANNSTENNASEINKNAVKSMISELIEQAGEEGEISSSLSTPINEIYKGSIVNWRNVLKRFLSGRGKAIVRKTCKKVSRRFDDLPGNKRSVGTTALIALDESGSISDTQVMKFYNELLAVKKITGADISVTEFDTDCTEPVSISRYTRHKSRTKNGGTDFNPVFKLADEMRIPLVIIFTDGDGPAPESVNQKVLWVLTKSGRMPAKYGHSVVFED